MLFLHDSVPQTVK